VPNHTKKREEPPNLHEIFNITMMTIHLDDHIQDNKFWYLDFGASAHGTRNEGNINNGKRTVDYTSVKFATSHTHKVYGKGKAIVAYQGEIKTMNNVLYAYMM
jgi:hypothetical protein